jgi:tripartite-type tricarboxylate transporter receptor subunit TctC
MKRAYRALASVGLAIAAGAAFSPAKAESVADFYKGKTINVYIGYGAGGGYDLYGRLLARYIGAHLPGTPTVVAQNMPGAGSLKAANYLFNVAPKDGTALGIVTQSTPQEEALGTKGIAYRANQFIWIGRMTSNVELTVVWHTSGVKTIEDVKNKETFVAGTGPTTPSEVFPRVLNGVVGTKFKVVAGYRGSAESVLAMERGEVTGALVGWATMKSTKQPWLQEKKVNVLVQYAMKRHPDLPDVPTMVELGKTDEDRKILALYASGADIGRAFLAPPKVPADRVKALRTAFDDMVKDPALLADIKKGNIEFDPMSGEELQKLAAESVDVPAALIARAKAVRDAK